MNRTAREWSEPLRSRSSAGAIAPSGTALPPAARRPFDPTRRRRSHTRPRPGAASRVAVAHQEHHERQHAEDEEDRMDDHAARDRDDQQNDAGNQPQHGVPPSFYGFTRGERCGKQTVGMLTV